MIRETEINPTDFIFPLFVRHGKDIQQEISSMPGNYQWSVDTLAAEAKDIASLGIQGVILFGIPGEKDPKGLENFAPDGIVQQAIKEIKNSVPEMVVVTDVIEAQRGCKKARFQAPSTDKRIHSNVRHMAQNTRPKPIALAFEKLKGKKKSAKRKR